MTATRVPCGCVVCTRTPQLTQRCLCRSCAIWCLQYIWTCPIHETTTTTTTTTTTLTPTANLQWPHTRTTRNAKIQPADGEDGGTGGAKVRARQHLAPSLFVFAFPCPPFASPPHPLSPLRSCPSPHLAPSFFRWDPRRAARCATLCDICGL